MKQIMIIGNVGKEPTTRTLSDGKEYLIFSVAVSTRNGAEWYGVCAPNLQKVAPYLTKGRMVFVQGQPKFSVYRETVDIIIYADSVQLCGDARREGGAPMDAAQSAPPASGDPATRPESTTLPLDLPQIPQPPTPPSPHYL